MRDKLIEIIQNSVGGCARHWAEVIADGFIYSGVILPPCKVGDVVYEVSSNFPEGIRESKVVGLLVCQDGTIGVKTDYSYPLTREIGVMLFLTREEAEKALKRVPTEMSGAKGR